MKRQNKRKGIAIGWAIVTIMMMVGIMALMIEGARIYYTSHQLQIAADAAALAGVRYVAVYANPNYNGSEDTNARDVAAYYAMQNPVLGGRQIQLDLNESNDPDGEIVIGRYIPQYASDDDPTTIPFIETLDTPNAMKVLDNMGNNSLNQPLPMRLGTLFGGQSKNLSRYAIARVINAYGAAVIALSDTDVGIYLHGNPEINIDNGGSIYSNTINTSADFRGNPATDVAEINLVGDYHVSGNFDPEDQTYNGLPASLNTDVDPIEDPYADLPEPSYAGLPNLGTISAAGTAASPQVYSPGYYSGGISKPKGGYITLLPGIYILGQGIDIKNGQCMIVAEGVMFYIPGGNVDIQGGNLKLSPPTSGTYKDISIFQGRSNTNSTKINGNGGLDMTGVLYFPNNPVWVAGNGDTIGTQLIADTIEIAGTGAINIPWNGSPVIVNKSYLVE